MAEQEKEILEEEILEETMEAAEEAEETAEAVEEVAEEIDSEEVPEGEEPKTWAEKRAAKKQKKEEANADKEKIAELEDRVKRQLAEFENYRNRTEKEKQAMFETGAKSVLEKLLPIIDNFERGFSTVDEADKEDAFVQGMQKVYKQMMDELEKIGVKPIEAVGQEFNPDFHNAVMHIEDENFGENIVAEEFQKGYMYKDSVVRHSMVKVAN